MEESRAVLNSSFLEETKKLRLHIEGAFLVLGEKLYKIKSEKMWEGVYDSYEDFLKDIDLTPGNASKLRQIYEKLMLEQGFQPSEIAKIGQRKLYSILPLCTDKKTTQGVLQDISGLHSKDVDKLVSAKKAGEHEHEWIEYRMCEVCKESHRIYDQET